MTMLALVMTVALVTEEPAMLRAEPREGASVQAQLWRGEWLEVRGEAPGFLKVYDHRRERPGYVRSWQVRPYALDEQSAPTLRTLTIFLRDARGLESLGIGYGALYLRAAPPAVALSASDVLDAIGTMAERLGRRASLGSVGVPGSVLSQHLDVAASYGIRWDSIEQQGRVRLCYEGDAYRRVLAIGSGAEPAHRARAALAITDPACTDPGLTSVAAETLVGRQMTTLRGLQGVLFAKTDGARLALRRAQLLGFQAFAAARRAEGEAARRAVTEAIAALASVDRADLSPEDGSALDETAVRVAASRWAAEPASAPEGPGPAVEIVKGGEPGQTCVRIDKVAFERCTFGVVWPASLRRAPSGNRFTLAVQPLFAWTELWVFERDGNGRWQLDTLTPATSTPEVGYVETVGFSPDGGRLLVVREAMIAHHLARSFQVLATRPALHVEKQASQPSLLIAFRRWAPASWRQQTLALR